MKARQIPLAKQVLANPKAVEQLLDLWASRQQGNGRNRGSARHGHTGTLGDCVLRPSVAVQPKDAAAPEAERFYPVGGDSLVLRYAEAVTLSIEYIQLRQAPDQPA
jgi:hypothetical protein